MSTPSNTRAVRSLCRVVGERCQPGAVLRLLRVVGGRLGAHLSAGRQLSDTRQLLINTPTTILTFLLVAVLQNSQRRGEQALQTKLDAVADGLADLMEHFLPSDEDKDADLAQDVADLKRIVGLE